MSNENPKTTIEKPACSGSAEAPLLCFNNIYIGELVHALKIYKTVPQIMDALLVKDYRETLTKNKITMNVFSEFAREVGQLKEKGLCEDSVKEWLIKSQNKLTNIFTEICKRDGSKYT